jgi:hypothetical protein
MKRIALVLVTLALLLGVLVFALGKGWLVESWHAGSPSETLVPEALIQARGSDQTRAATKAGVKAPKQILFGDLHVHSTFSADAFQMALPMSGGEGAHPVAGACDFARYCSALDFWSINDHAITLTPQRWSETVDTIRHCNAMTSATNPDVVAYLGWEWTQVGSKPENHWGHKNVIFRDLDSVPARPIMAGPPPDAPPLTESFSPSTWTMGAFALAELFDGGPQAARYFQDVLGTPLCPTGVPVRDLPSDCQEQAVTPGDLFAKLDDWGLESMVIPHGTTWGMYTPPGSSWDKQLSPAQHDPERQPLIEVFSGHGNSEEFRAWREVVLHADGSRSCAPPTRAFLPACWRAGEIIEERCRDAGEEASECAERAAEARQLWVDADRNGGRRVIPDENEDDWQDAGQCRDCFQASFNYRPRSSVQYIMSLGRPSAPEGAQRFRFGFIGSSDNHSGRPGTGYKEIERTTFTEARFGNFANTLLARHAEQDPDPRAEPFDAMESNLPIFAIWETERGASFFLNGGLAAVHAEGRGRGAIWDAMKRREVYATSGPRILLWFDLVNDRTGRVPMGSEIAMTEVPRFEVRAVGSFEQRQGCPEYSVRALEADQLQRLCRNECYHPSETRRPISRIEVVRIRPQRSAHEDVAVLVDDPWRVFPCDGNPAGCSVRFGDDEFAKDGRDTVYYARAIESPSMAVAADPYGCERDDEGRCVTMQRCFDRPEDDDCLSETEERAWSSPIFVDFGI